jgi:pyruvate/2-oxoglutarate dehydrogenase complex dihydrolipoamide acyltransferase (E2) component
MARQFTLPVGEGLAEAEIVSWLVNEGDHVVANQPLVSVETDKAVVEYLRLTDEVDIDAWSEDADITIRLVQAIAAACKAEPSLNAWFNSEAGE